MPTFKGKNNTSVLAALFSTNITLISTFPAMGDQQEYAMLAEKARSRVFPVLVYHGMYDCSVVPFVLRTPPSSPLQHPGVAFVKLHHLPHPHTPLTPSVPSEPFPSPPPCLTITLLRRHNTASPSPQAFSVSQPALFKKGSVLTSHKKGKS